MRKVVSIEGKPMVDGRLILNGALEPGKDVIPVTYGIDFDRIVAQARDFERNEETGEVSFDLTFDPRIPELDRETYGEMDASVFCRPFETGSLPPYKQVVTKATIMGITLSPNSWAWRRDG